MGTEKTRVAVYRRVPRNQKSYAGLIGADERRINSESSMLYAGSYIDQDGCRGAFKRLMAAAGEGDIDRIETESISAFANNIGELLTTVCKLRCLRHPVGTTRPEGRTDYFCLFWMFIISHPQVTSAHGYCFMYSPI